MLFDSFCCHQCALAVLLLCARVSLSQRDPQPQFPPECAPHGAATNLLQPGSFNGVGMVNSAQITYSADRMPDVTAVLLDDHEGRRVVNMIDCRWTLQCTDNAQVPRVTFTAFETKSTTTMSGIRNSARGSRRPQDRRSPREPAARPCRWLPLDHDAAICQRCERR